MYEKITKIYCDISRIGEISDSTEQSLKPHPSSRTTYEEMVERKPDSRHPCHCLCIFRACSRRTTRRCHQPSPSDKSHKIPLDKKWSELLRKHRPEIRWCWCARALHTNHMISVVYLMIEWTIEIRRDADVVKHHCPVPISTVVPLGLHPYHPIPSHPRWTICPLHVDCIDFFAPCKRNWTSTRESHHSRHTASAQSVARKADAGKPGCEGACYICMYMYIHTYILHPDIYPTYDFFFLSDRHPT